MGARTTAAVLAWRREGLWGDAKIMSEAGASDEHRIERDSSDTEAVPANSHIASPTNNRCHTR